MTKLMSCCVLMLAFAAGNAGASLAEPFVGADGCAILGAAVYDQIAAGGPSGAGDGAVLRNPGDTDVVICNQTARTVTAAFSKAMSSLGIDVSWSGARQERGDECLSAFLSQCYPNQDIGPYGLDAVELVYVYDTWRLVQGSTARFMLFGYFSDTTVFAPGELQRAMAPSVLP